MHHQKVTRYSCNLKIGMEYKHTVQTQIRLLPLIRVCTLSYSAGLNKHKRNCGDDSILNIGLKYLSIHCVSWSYCSILSGSTQVSINIWAYTVYPDHTTPPNPGILKFLFYFYFFKQFRYLIKQLYGVPFFYRYYGVSIIHRERTTTSWQTSQENLICILYCASYAELSQWDDPIKMHKIFSGNRVARIILCSATQAVWTVSFKSVQEINIPAKIINPCQFITDPLKSSRIFFHQSLATS